MGMDHRNCNRHRDDSDAVSENRKTYSGTMMEEENVVLQGLGTLAAGSAWIGGMSEQAYKDLARGETMPPNHYLRLVEETERSLALMAKACEGIKAELLKED